MFCIYCQHLVVPLVNNDLFIDETPKMDDYSVDKTTAENKSNQSSTNKRRALESQEKLMEKEEKSIIVSSKVLMDDEDKKPEKDMETITAGTPLKSVELIKNNFLRDSSEFINILRKKVVKKSLVFNIFECPKG